jgi:hypothetical protein
LVEKPLDDIPDYSLLFPCLFKSIINDIQINILPPSSLALPAAQVHPEPNQ